VAALAAFTQLASSLPDEESFSTAWLAESAT
jgi:hypothetical protein